MARARRSTMRRRAGSRNDHSAARRVTARRPQRHTRSSPIAMPATQRLSARTTSASSTERGMSTASSTWPSTRAVRRAMEPAILPLPATWQATPRPRSRESAPTKRTWRQARGRARCRAPSAMRSRRRRFPRATSIALCQPKSCSPAQRRPSARRPLTLTARVARPRVTVESFRARTAPAAPISRRAGRRSTALRQPAAAVTACPRRLPTRTRTTATSATKTWPATTRPSLTPSCTWTVSSPSTCLEPANERSFGLRIDGNSHNGRRESESCDLRGKSGRLLAPRSVGRRDQRDNAGTLGAWALDVGRRAAPADDTSCKLAATRGRSGHADGGS